jgi:hypothetical protein
VPTARGETAEEGAARGIVVEMERLRIEFGRESLDRRRVDAAACGDVSLPRGELF